MLESDCTPIDSNPEIARLSDSALGLSVTGLPDSTKVTRMPMARSTTYTDFNNQNNTPPKLDRAADQEANVDNQVAQGTGGRAAGNAPPRRIDQEEVGRISSLLRPIAPLYTGNLPEWVYRFKMALKGINFDSNTDEARVACYST